MSKPLCLIVDDEPDLRYLSVETLRPMNIECYTAENLAQAKDYLQSHTFDLCLTDMRLPDGNGIELVTLIQENYPNTSVAVITAHGNIKSAVQAMREGAFDFIPKPIDVPQLRNLVSSVLKLPRSPSSINEPELSVRRDQIMSRLIGKSQMITELRAQIERLARNQAAVYIRGESGTGKEVVARLIHDLGSRADKAFVPVNCGAIPTELMESEFFGHKKGSFTGAHIDKIGLFQAADGGTLFLDEVADLPFPMQVKLLRAIQEKQIRPVGSSKEIAVDVRILSATHRDLAKLVEQQKFRQDLFYRINVIEVNVPPLRERTEDIPDLVDNILKRFNTTNIPTDSGEEQKQPELSEDALNTLKNYDFPGNVRELENIIERAMTLCENNIIRNSDLQLPKSSSETVITSRRGTSDLDPFLSNIERETIMDAIKQTKGNKTKAADLLGISFAALRYRLSRLEKKQKTEKDGQKLEKEQKVGKDKESEQDD